MSVYPLFMSAGYYVATAIPGDPRIGADGRDGQGRPATVLRPLGPDPRLPGVVADLAATRARVAEVDPVAATLLLVAHGSSKNGKSMEAALAIAGSIADTGRFAGVETVFLEEPPFLDDVLRAVSEPAIVVGLFVGEGMHGGEDLPQAPDRCGRRDVFLAEPLGRSPAFVSLVCDDADQLDVALPDSATAE